MACVGMGEAKQCSGSRVWVTKACVCGGQVVAACVVVWEGGVARVKRWVCRGDPVWCGGGEKAGAGEEPGEVRYAPAWRKVWHGVGAVGGAGVCAQAGR